jgi:hypothetical protein
MDALEKFLSGGQAVAEPPKKPTESTRIPADVQAQRDKDALAIHEAELKQAKAALAQATDSKQKIRLEADIAGLTREIARNPASKAQPTAQPAAPSAPSAPVAASGDPLEAFLSGKTTTAPVAAKAAPVASQAAPVAQQEGYYDAVNPHALGGARYAVRQAIDQAQEPGGVRQLVGKFLKSALETKREIPERVAGAIDTLYGIVPATYGAAVQALARTAQSPERAEQTGQAAAASIDKPLGKALGLTGKETYQKPLGGITEPVIEQVKKMAEQLGMTPKQISEKTGIPEQDIKNMMVIGSVAVPQAIKEVAPVVKETVQAVTTPIKQAAAELQIVKPGQLTKEQAQAQFEAKQAPAGSAGAAAAANNPFAGKITGEETVRGQFPQIKLSKTPTDVPVNEQILRSQAVQEVMPGVGVRPGVVTGNENLLRNEHTKAKLDTPEGQLFKQQIANEQIALSKYADERVDATGASRTLINDEQRGGRINDVLYGTSPDDMASSSIMGYLNQAKKQVYDSAYKRVGGNQIKTTNVDDLLKNPQWAAGLKIKGVEGVQSAAKDYLNLAKTVGFEDINGVMHPPGSVAAYDAVRKAINADWTPQNANAIRRVNQAIDKDIAAVADPALYKLGDRIHEVEKTIFGSKGIKTLFGEMDKNGVITSSTPLEKIPSKMNNLPKDQWRHIRETLNDLANGNVKGAPEGMPPVPQELRQSAAAAVAEIDGALAREVQKAGSDKMGVWNQNSANKTMNSLVGEKILETFPPDEVRRFHLLNTVGQIVPGIHAYEGAALQARRVGVIEGNLPKIGAGAGAALGGFVGEAPGAAVGTYLGQQAGAKYKAKIEEKALTKEAKKSQKEMEKATALGKQTGKNKIEDLNK